MMNYGYLMLWLFILLYWINDRHKAYHNYLLPKPANTFAILDTLGATLLVSSSELITEPNTPNSINLLIRNIPDSNVSGVNEMFANQISFEPSASAGV